MMSSLASPLEAVQLAIADETLGSTTATHATTLRAIEALRIAAYGPGEYLARIRYAPLSSACIILAAESGLLQALHGRATGTHGSDANATTAALAVKTGTGTVLATRVLRFLAGIMVIDELEEGVYRANSVTTCLLSHPGQLGALNVIAKTTLPNFSRTVDYFRSTGFHQFPDAANGEVGAFEATHGDPLWAFLSRDPESKKNFDDYMGARTAARTQAWWEKFELVKRLGAGQGWQREKSAFVVDVGGGDGHDLASLLAQHPNLTGSLVLQDLPETLARATLLPKGIEPVAYDFFKPQTVKGARVYYFHSVLHDWSDELCLSILRNTVKAMDPDYSTVLIDDWVLPNTKAPIKGLEMDILMMYNVGGIERTLSQWETLLAAAGLRIVNIWPPAEIGESVLEARCTK